MKLVTCQIELGRNGSELTFFRSDLANYSLSTRSQSFSFRRPGTGQDHQRCHPRQIQSSGCPTNNRDRITSTWKWNHSHRLLAHSDCNPPYYSRRQGVLRCNPRYGQYFLSRQTRPTTPSRTSTRLVTYNRRNGSLSRPHLPSTVTCLTPCHARVSSRILPPRLSPINSPPTRLHRTRLPHSIPLAKQSRRRRQSLRKSASSSTSIRRRTPTGSRSSAQHHKIRPDHRPERDRHHSRHPSTPHLPSRGNQHNSLCFPHSPPYVVPPCSPSLPSYHQRGRSSPRSWRTAASS